MKDFRKRNNKKLRKSLKITNRKSIKEVPIECKNFVESNDVVYVVPGDGACGPNSAAAFLFHDESLGPQLRTRMCKFQATHWHRRYQDITPCTPEFPYTRKLRGKQITFTDPDKLIDFLNNVKEAAYMWTDSDDLAIIADMYQIRIKIITIGRSNNIPTVNWIYPEEKMAEFAILKNVDMGVMVLLHDNDNHFDLVISSDHELAANNRDEPKQVILLDNQSVVKQKFKMLLEKNRLLEAEYALVEKQLKMKTVQVKKLEVELADLKKIRGLVMDVDEEKEKEIEESYDLSELVKMKKSGFQRESPQCKPLPQKEQDSLYSAVVNSFSKVFEEFNCRNCFFQGNSQEELGKHLLVSHSQVSIPCDQCDETFPSNSDFVTHLKTKHIKNNFKCGSCGDIFSTSSDMENHKNSKHKSSEIKCKYCGEQFSQMSELEDHFKRVHGLDNMKCRNCKEEFEKKSDLMVHRKSKHNELVAQCRKNLIGKCYFTSSLCWWNHSKKDEQNIECYYCDKDFESVSHLMIHRKKEHGRTVKPCSKFIQKECKFSSELCWYKHEAKIENSVETIFQEVQIKQKPQKIC